MFRKIWRISLVKDSLWMLLAQCISFSILAAYFLIASRSLGVENYGAFLGVAALAGIISPFSGWGAEHLLSKNVSIDKDSLPASFGNGLFLIAISGSTLTLLAMLVLPVLFSDKVPNIATFSILVADLIGLKLIVLANSVLNSLYLFRLSALAKISVAVCKLTAAFIFSIFFLESNIIGWSILYCLATLIPALIMVALICWKLSLPRFSASLIVAEMKQGFYFAINATSESINANLDKSMLASLSSLTSAGLYGAAYRFIDFGYFPIFSIQSATYPRFFKHGALGIKGSWSFAKRLLPLAFAYGTISALFIIFAAPTLVPYLLGNEYKDSVPVLIWLSPIHFLLSLQFLLSDTLTAAGLQGIRSGVQVTAAVMNFSLNYLMIPLFSWRGAALATLLTEVSKLAALCLLVFLFLKKQNRRTKEASNVSSQ